MSQSEGEGKMIDREIAAIGDELVRSSVEGEFSAQQGLVDELWPYIYRASKRMSSRAISRWLKDEKNIKLSPVTIAKALRESDRYWLKFFDPIEAAALIVARAHGVESIVRLLEDECIFSDATNGIPTVAGDAGIDEYDKAKDTIAELWFGETLDALSREECLGVVCTKEREEEAEGKSDEGGSKSSGEPIDRETSRDTVEHLHEDGPAHG